MKRTLFNLALCLAFIAGCMAVAPAFAFDSTDGNWYGGYTGFSLGLAAADFSHNDGEIGPSGSDSAPTGSVDIGVNLESSKFVYGAELEAGALFNEAKNEDTKFFEDWMADVRALAGYDLGRFLPYATAGLAFTNTVAETPDGYHHQETGAGLAAGVGLAYSLSPRWFARIEYLNVDVPNVDSTSNGVMMNGGSDNSIIRVGLNHRF